jgi:trehalose 6-phosphate synthase/phosphatase
LKHPLKSVRVWQAQECQNHLENAVLSKLPVEILVGKKNLEVRPQMINKGEIVKRLLTSQNQLNSGVEFVFCAGDDKTDEDMFKSLRKVGIAPEKVFTCTIGNPNKKTNASWHLTRPEDIIDLLSKMASISS